MLRCLFISLLAALGMHGVSQQKDILTLLDAHDLLYFNRLADSFYISDSRSAFFSNNQSDTNQQKFYSDTARALILQQAGDIMTGIENIDLLKNNYPFSFAQFKIEYYTLKAIIKIASENKETARALDTTGTGRDNDKYSAISLLDSVDYFFNNTITPEEKSRLKMDAGARSESIMSKKQIIHAFATDPAQGLLHDALILKYNSSNPLKNIAKFTDLQLLLELHEYLFVMRTNKNYSSSPQVNKIYSLVRKTLQAIKDIEYLRINFRQSYSAFDIEFSYLQWLVKKDHPGETAILERLQILDRVIEYYNNDRFSPMAKAVQAALYTKEKPLLEKLIGVRLNTIAKTKETDIHLPLLYYNEEVVALLDNELIKYKKTKISNLKKVYSIAAMYKNYQEYQISKTIFSPTKYDIFILGTDFNLPNGLYGYYKAFKTMLSLKKTLYYFQAVANLKEKKCKAAFTFTIKSKIMGEMITSDIVLYSVVSLEDFVLSAKERKYKKYLIDRVKFVCPAKNLFAEYNQLEFINEISAWQANIEDYFNYREPIIEY